MINREKLAKYLDLTIIYGICGLVIALPLYFTVIKKTAPGFVINLAIDKSVIFNIFIEILSVLALFKVFISEKVTIYGSLRKYVLFLPFFILVAVAVIFSVDRHTSIYGFYWRQQGLITYVHYLLFLAVLAISLSGRRVVEKLIASISIGSLLVSVIGLLHWLDLDFLKLQRFEDVRPGSTLGQPVFLGNYLVLTSFLALYKLRSASSSWGRVSYALIFLVNTACLVVTYTRAAWLGFIVGGMLLSAYYVNNFLKNRFRPGRAFYFATIGTLAIILVAALSSVGSSQQNTVGARLKSSFDFSVGSVFLRFQYWKGALELIGKSPLIGYGLESQHVLFLDYYNSEWAERENINAFSDRAHNEYLDIALTSGLSGLAAYLLLIGFIVSVFFKRWRNREGEDGELELFLAVSLLAYSVSVFFSFSTIEVSALFWLYLAILAAANGGFKANENALDFLKKFRFVGWYVLGAVVVIAAIQVVENSYRVRADYYAVKGRFSSANGDQAATLSNYYRATALNPNEELYRDYYLSEMINLKSSVITLDDGQKQDNFEIVDSIIGKDQGLDSNYFREMRKATAYDYFFRQGKAEYLERSEKIYESLIARYPNLPDPYYYKGLLYYHAKRYEEAAAMMEKVFPLLPDPNGEAVNQQHKEIINRYSGQRYFMLGMAYFQLGEYAKSNEALERAIAANPYAANVYQQIGWNYYKLKKIDQAIEYYKRALTFAPFDYQGQLQIGKFYLEKKNNDEARRYFKMAESLNPKDPSIKDLLDKVKK